MLFSPGVIGGPVETPGVNPSDDEMDERLGEGIS